MKEYSGGCLCGLIRYKTNADPVFPHLCSCKTCQKWSGAPTLAWVEFPIADFEWINNGNTPKLFQSSEKTLRGNCPDCGSPICAIDEGYENISIVMGSLDGPDEIIPDVQHSFEGSKPSWWEAHLNTSEKGR